MRHKVNVEVGSTNIFADLGLPDANTHFLKAQIVSEIYRLSNERKLTQSKAGKRMGISQPEVSRLFKGHFHEYSIERLMEFLTGFDRDVEIVVKPHKKPGKAGRITFTPISVRSEQAPKRLPALRRPLPPGFRFNRNEANER
jgi:predicted XRE-type DNA-binding protein